MKICLIQLAVTETPCAWRREAVQQQLGRLRGMQPDLVVLPELWGVGFQRFSRYEACAETLDGETVRMAQAWAQELHCMVLSGSFVERTAKGTLRNTMVLVDKQGIVRGHYCKIHLFGYQSQETQLLTAGTHTVTLETDWGAMGLATCYDLRFPEQFRKMVDDGAHMFAVCAAWLKARLEHFRLLCQVRALENQCWLFACNACGTQDGVMGAGHSMVVAPDGMIVAEAGEQQETLVVDIDPSEVSRWRERFPALHDRVEL